ncbi:MAG: glycosyltransferase [Cyanobacteria bacterium RI_101]|nr:glycosyltransferase [Cyanobacteria bacterium RI_101]
MRLLIIQYGGDYGEAYQRLAAGGKETYIFQKYSVDYVADLTEKLEEVTTICIACDADYNLLLKPKLRAIGLGLQNRYDQKIAQKRIEAYINQLQPDKIILRFPSPEILSLFIKYKIQTLGLFADYFDNRTIKQKYKNFLLSQVLNHPLIERVCNHGVYASRTLAEIGVTPQKVIPWDFDFKQKREDFFVKVKPQSQNSFSLFYCGSLSESKGVGDILQAVSILKKQGFSVDVKIAGKDNDELFSNLARTLEITREVNFLGLIPNAQIIPLMRSADLVLIPSRREYPEGSPFTLQEGLISGTPVIVSDHPVFTYKLRDQENAMIFPSGDYVALSESIKEIMKNEALYCKLSLNAYETWLSLQIPCKFHNLLDNWLFHEPEHDSFLSKYNLLNY